MNLRNRLLIIFIALLLVGFLPNIAIITQTETPKIIPSAKTLDPFWYKDVQIYNMVAFHPEDIDKYHITVNGLWNGFIGENLTSPFAFGRLLESFFSGCEYESDEEFVSVQHDQGMIVPATILTTQGHESFQREQMEDFACRSIDGELCYWDLEAESYWMDAINQDFIDWCIEHGKKAIDANADIIVLDEIQGSSLVPMFQFASQYIGVPAPGFSDSTIEGFRTYLKDKYTPIELNNMFNIDDIDNYDLKNRIAETMDFSYFQRINTDSLIIEYIQFLDEGNFNAKKRLIEELRSYASVVGKDIIIGANSYTLGTNRPGDFWPKGLHFADLVDVFTFENTYTAFSDRPTPRFPRNKWLAWEKLANASTDATPVILIDTNALETINTKILPILGYSNYLSILCAEAFANQGCFVNYNFRFFGRAWNWNGCKRIHEFILNNKELYDSPTYIPTDLAILYLYGEGMHQKSDTYLGCAQALSESQIPFDVIFDGDGFYIDETLESSILSEYNTILIPSVVDITNTQEDLIKEYVESGGNAIVFDPEEIGFESIEGNYPYGNGSFHFILEDKGSLYFKTYNDKYRAELEEVVSEYYESTLTVEDSSRRIIAFPQLQKNEDKMIIHLVNYHHLGFMDIIWPKFSVNVRIKKPPFDINSAYVISPDFSEKQDLTFSENEDFIEFEVPYLRIYDVIIIE
jgi:hypothetical protein